MKEKKINFSSIFSPFYILIFTNSLSRLQLTDVKNILFCNIKKK